MASLMDFFNSALSLNSVGTGLEIGGKLLSGFSQIQNGNSAKDAAEFRAAQLRQQAIQQQASAQRGAYFAGRDARYVASNALAVAAASGGGASDPTVINIMAELAQEGAYRQQVALFQGDDKARGLNLQADATEYEGKAHQAAGFMSGITSGFGAASSLVKSQARDSSMFARFGGDGPPSGRY